MVRWRAYVAVGAVLIGVYALLPSGLVRDAIYLAMGVGAVTAILAGVRRYRPRSRAPWYLLAVGQGAWVLGDTMYSWYEDVLHISPFPSAADVAYLVAYPLLAAGIGLLIRGGGRGLDIRGLIDSSIVVAALGLVSWAWIAEPLAQADGVPWLERAIAVAYPVGDILLLAMLVRLVAAPGTTSVALRLLVGAVVLQVVADTGLAAAVSDSGTYMSGLDVVWLASYVLWGACALHPQMRDLSRRRGARSELFTIRRVVVLGAAAVLPPTAALVALTLGRSPDAWLSVSGTMLLTLLVVARMASAVVEVELTTQDRDRLEEELLHRATDDPLTGVLNRAYVLRVIGEALGRGQTSGAATGLIVVDLDGFKAVNDDLGPAGGDDVLVDVARRIREAAGPSRPVGRLHGDQFVVLVEHTQAVEATTRLAGELAARLAGPCSLAEGAVTVGAKIGVAVVTDGSTDASAVVHQALIAGRRAMSSPTGPFEVFDETLRRELAERAAIEEGLREAMDRDTLELHYQPVIDVQAVTVDGYEALLRWDRGDGVVSMPDEFVPVAEKSDLICDIGRWVLDRATRQFADWLVSDPDRFGAMTVAVNISGRHVADRRIVDDVARALDDSGLPARHLVVEVTETVLVDEPRSMARLEALRSLGVTVSLDDFGTGYTSIGQLRSLPVDSVKIDKSFMDATDRGSVELVALMTAAAHAGGMSVVVEGVERADQFRLLQDLACDRAQGYLFDAPLAADLVTTGSTVDRLTRLRAVPLR